MSVDHKFTYKEVYTVYNANHEVVYCFTNEFAADACVIELGSKYFVKAEFGLVTERNTVSITTLNEFHKLIDNYQEEHDKRQAARKKALAKLTSADQMALGIFDIMNPYARDEE